MNIDALIRDPSLQALMPRLERLRDKRFSDLVDGQGHQYVDLVMGPKSHGR